MSDITVHYNGKKILLPLTNRSLSLQLLQQYFPKAQGLTYKAIDGIHAVPVISGELKPDPSIEEFDIFTVQDSPGKAPSNSKNQRIQEILSQLKKRKGKENDSENTNCKPEPKKNKVVNTSDELSKQKLTRYLRVGWLHRVSSAQKYTQMKQPFGGVKELELVTSRSYSLQEIKDMAIKAFSNKENCSILKNSCINLGNFNGSTVRFENSNGQTCDVWEYCKTKQTILSKLKLYILTSTDAETVDLLNDEDEDTVTPSASHTLDRPQSSIPVSISETRAPAEDAQIDNLTNNLLDDTYNDAATSDTSKSTFSSFSENNNLTAGRNNIRVFYTSCRRSKYSNQYSIMEVERKNLHSYLCEDDNDTLPSIEEFDPVTSGYEIARIEKSGTVLVEISTDTNLKKTFSFPSVTSSVAEHQIIHDVDQVHGYCEGKFGIGIVSNCTNTCHPTFTWFCDGKACQTGKFLYWLNNVCSSDSNEHTWNCIVRCDKNASGAMSKSIKVRQQKFSADVNCNKLNFNDSLKSGCVPLIKRDKLSFSKTLLGAGAQGKVWKGSWLGTEVAIKTLKIANTNGNLIAREMAVLECIRHPNIIQVMAFCPEPKQFHIVTEYFPGTSLSDVLFDDDMKEEYRLNINNKGSICNQICKAVAYLHAQEIPIIHRDIKPDNILLNKELTVKLCDLGLSKFCQMAALTSTIGGQSAKGTLMYMAPEMLLEKKPATVHSDVWAVGCTLAEIYTESFVWNLDEEDMEQSLRNQLKMRMIPDLSQVPVELRSILRQCFSYADIQRPTVIEIVQLYSQTISDGLEDSSGPAWNKMTASRQYTSGCDISG